MIDAAHCGDSDLSVSENEKVIKELAKADALGIFMHQPRQPVDVFQPMTDGLVPFLLPMHQPEN